MTNVTPSEARGNRSAPIIVPKNSIEQLQLSLSEYEGHRYADLRVYYRNDDDEFVPTRKGITVSPARWRAFREAVDELESRMQAKVLLP